MILEKKIQQASQILKNHNIQSHQLDAQLLLAEIMGVKKEYLITNDQISVSKKLLKNMITQLNDEQKKNLLLI